MFLASVRFAAVVGLLRTVGRIDKHRTIILDGRQPPESQFSTSRLTAVPACAWSES
jgi:hypothetical protein